MKAFYKSKIFMGDEHLTRHINLDVKETKDDFIITFPELLTDKIKNEELEVIILDKDVGTIDIKLECELNDKGELEVVDG